MARLYFYRSQMNDYRWHIIANNGKIIGASSEGYWNKADCETNAKTILNSTILANPVYNW